MRKRKPACSRVSNSKKKSKNWSKKENRDKKKYAKLLEVKEEEEEFIKK